MAVDPQHTIDAMRRIEAALERFADSAEMTIAQADREITQVEQQLELRRRELASDLEAAKEDLKACQKSGTYDEDGYYNPPDCSAEEWQVRELQQALDVLRVLADNFDAIAQSYRSLASQLRSAVDSTVPEASHFLRGRESALIGANTPGADIPSGRVSYSGGSTSGFGTGHVTNMPPEKREGNIGGPERKG